MATIDGDETDNTLFGTDDDDTIRGFGGNDILIGAAGGDLLDGGSGFDISDYSDAIGPVIVHMAVPSSRTGIAAGDVFIGIEGLRGGAFDDVLLGTADSDSLSGGGGSDQLAGGSGDDTLDGGSGIDVMGGATGDDLYFIDHLNDQINEKVNEGFDSAYVFVSGYTLNFHVEQAVAQLTGGMVLLGNDQDNQLVGNIGNDTLDGSTGMDSMRGGTGDDLYFIDHFGDEIFENTGEGFDTAYFLSNDRLPAQVEQAVAQLTTGMRLAGNDQNNHLIGNIGNDNLIGLGGNDDFSGGSGNDTIDGGTGIDGMGGGVGDDLYFVDHLSDTIFENIGEGFDTADIHVDGYTLHPHIEQAFVRLAGGATLSGNDQNNHLFGAFGNDNLIGNGGNDNFNGGGGNDTIDGGTGIDGMGGSTGDDLYFIDNLGDTIFENAGEGFDTAYVFVDGYTIHPNVEQAEVRLASGMTLSGNDQDNQLFGSTGNDNLLGNGGNDNFFGAAGNDTIDGGAGIDGMGGSTGDDLFFIRDAGDTVFENAGEGTDSVYSYINGYTLDANVENGFVQNTSGITLTGNSAANSLFGNTGNDQLIGAGGNDSFNGGDGNDTLDGGTGNDMLGGSTGNDTFVFTNGDGLDTIADFNTVDVIQLSGYAATDFAAVQALFSDSGGNAIITFDASNSITINNVASNLLMQDDFNFV